MILRSYQRAFADAAIAELKKSVEPIMGEAATGAGKSLIIAEIARAIHEMTGKRILCTAPSAELVLQNRERYAATGNKCSIFSASAGAKSLRYPVVYGSPLTIKNRITAFKQGYALVIIDECDLITPTLKAIIDAMREGNPLLRVMGLTATPYRLGTGYIFREWPDGRVNGEDKAREPYFGKMVYRVEGRQLIQEGYLTPPTIGGINASGYDTHSLLLNKQGKFDSAEVDRAYHGHGRKTAAIVGDVVFQSQNRRGVLLYAATIQHAQEILASLPPGLSAIVTGTTPTTERRSIISRLRAQKIKYVVSVGALTVGLDVPHVDVIAVLRKTESVRLLQQIIGRGLRLFDGKKDCLYLDYTSNLEDHCPDGDLFAPVVKTKKASEGARDVKAQCPQCGYENEFTRHKDAEGYELDGHGYCLDVFGQRVETDFGPMSGHYGRRCMGLISVSRGEYDRCGYYWTSKICEACDEPNDIAARFCKGCKAEMVNPNDRLIADFKAMKKDPTLPQTDEVISMTAKEKISQKGNPTLQVEWKTTYRQFTTWFMPEATSQKGIKDWQRFKEATNEGGLAPRTISYAKERDSQFYRVLAYNQEPDEAP